MKNSGIFLTIFFIFCVLFGTSYAADNDPLTVSNIDPVNGSVDVSLNKVITITFNKDIFAGVNYDKIKVITPDNKAKIINKSINGNTLTISSKYAYNQGETFKIYIPSNAISDSDGKNLTNNFYSFFTTGISTVVSSIDPSNMQNVESNKIITITFNDSIQAGVNYDKIKVITPDNKAKIINKSINGNTLTITSKYAYAPGTYTIYIPINAVQNTAGIELANNFTSKFIVGAPKVVDLIYGNILDDKTIAVIFDKPVEIGTDYSKIKVITPDNKAKIITTTIDGNVLTITAKYDYLVGLEYKLLIPKNAIISNGMSLTEDYINFIAIYLQS